MLQKNAILFILFHLLLKQVREVDVLADNEFAQILRGEWDGDRWSWGFVDFKPTITGGPFPPTYYPPDHPCAPYKPQPPDFRDARRRISETKCLEYIWQAKSRIDISARSNACRKSRGPNKTSKQNKGSPNSYPNFAIGGHDTLAGEFPHMAAIGWEAAVGTWVFQCSSSLISPNFVLTAAHCTRASERDTTIADVIPKIVRFGNKNIIDVWSNGQAPLDVKILRSIVHPLYNSPMKYYDIALMQLEKAVEFTNYVQPACLWSIFDTSILGSQATLTGWGVIETGGRTTSPELQAAVVDVIDSQYCDELLRPTCNRLWCGVQDHQVCAGKLAGGVDGCQGDSGGPLQVKINLPTNDHRSMHYVIGVTSFARGCARPNTPGIYTRVASFIDWIEDNVWR